MCLFHHIGLVQAPPDSPGSAPERITVKGKAFHPLFAAASGKLDILLELFCVLKGTETS